MLPDPIYLSGVTEDTAARKSGRNRLTHLDMSGLCSKALEQLRVAHHQVLSVFEEESGYTLHECELLWQAVIRYLQNLPALCQLHENLTDQEDSAYRRLNPGAALRLAPYGHCLITIPSNAPLPLAYILPLSFAAAGNHVLVTAPSAIRKTTALLVGLVQELIPEQISLWPGRVRDAVEAALHDKSIDLLYYTGSSSHLPAIAQAAAAAGVHLIYEGEGRSVAIVPPHLDDAQMMRAALQFYESKTAFGGRMCSAPNLLALPQMDEARLLISLKSRFGLQEIALHEAGESREPSGGLSFQRANSVSATEELEWFSPKFYLHAYGSYDQLISGIGRLRYNLQVSMLGRSFTPAELNLLSGKFVRLCQDMTPTMQDPLLPWGCSGLSGQSEQLDFYRKALRRVLVECWTEKKIS